MRRVLLAVLAGLCMAPTAGDVGGCGAEVVALDTAAFARDRKSQDCRACQDCALEGARCARACDPNAATDVVIPSTCRPLEHDGEVCLRALRAASCEDYAGYVSDAPSTPGECSFCRTEGAP